MAIAEYSAYLASLGNAGRPGFVNPRTFYCTVTFTVAVVRPYEFVLERV